MDTNRMQSQVVVGVFDDQNRAQQAVNELRSAGFNDNQIGFALRGGRMGNVGTTPVGTGEGVAGNTVGGAVAGGAIGALIGAGAALLIPGIGPAVAGGILATALTGGAIGAVAGGLLGALTGLGVPEEEARFYQQEFEAGRVVVTVQAGNRAQEALSILQRYGAYQASKRAASVPMQPATTSTRRWEDERPYYQTNWQQRYGTQGGRWEDQESAYQFGWEAANNPRYRGRTWSEVEPELRREWESRYPNRPWNQVSAMIREAAVTVMPSGASYTQGTQNRTYS
jgi:hypothetical protein